MLDGSLVTTAWRVLGLRMEGSPPGTKDSYECIEYQSRTADKGWGWALG